MTADRTPIAAMLVAAVSIALSPSALAVTNLLYDSEPNDAPHSAVDLALPEDGNVVRIIGDLVPGDQDAFRIVVDEDEAGKRFHLSLAGRSGALTQLDVFDFTALADGRGRIPETLTEPPARLMNIATQDAALPARRDFLLLAPGVYVFGVSHSGGEGAYTAELTEVDNRALAVLDGEQGTEASPRRLSANGSSRIWTQGETWYSVDIDEKEAESAYDLIFQTALGRPVEVTLFGPDGAELLSMRDDGGMPVARPGLRLAQGIYRIRTRQAQAGAQLISLPRGAPAPADGREVEPNDSHPTPMAFAEPFAGRFDAGDTDWVGFTVDEARAAHRWDFEIRGGPESAIEVCLGRDAMRLQHCVRGRDGQTAIRSLGLAAGDYRVRLSDRGPDGAEWQLNWIDRGEARAGEELEPNNNHQHPTALHERGFGRGTFDGKETDHWRFDVSGEPQLWRLQFQGDDIHEIHLKTTGGKVVSSERAGAATRARLDNLFLMPGRYVIAVSGNASDYIVRAQPLGPPPPGMEIEPNDSVADARPIRFGQEYFGLLAEEGDADVYRFTLRGGEHVRLTVQPPVDGAYTGYLSVGDDEVTVSEIRNGAKPGEPMVWDAFLPPADYSLRLKPYSVSDAEYTVTLARGDWLDLTADREPNGSRGKASPFPIDGRLVGRVGATNESSDWYRLPKAGAETTIEWPVPKGYRVEVFDDAEPDENRVVRDREAGVDRVLLEPGREYALEVSGNAEYAIDLSSLSPDSGTAPPPSVELTLEDRAVQSYSPWAQTLHGELVVRNTGDAARDIELEAHLTDDRWGVEGIPPSISLEAGGEHRIAFQLRIPSDAVMSPPARVSARARAGSAVGSPDWASVRVVESAAPVRPAFHWHIDEPLRGSFNAAALRFGAEALPSPGFEDDKIADIERLFDGLARYGRWTGTSLRTNNDDRGQWGQPTVRLAGDDPVPVRGFLINPLSSLGPDRYPGIFEIAVSDDGSDFRTVLRDRLEPRPVEQAFVLDEPVSARYVRFIPVTAAYGNARSWGTLGLGQLKVLAEPGWRPADEPFNLADPGNGGHLVFGMPWVRGSAGNTEMLIADDSAADGRLGEFDDATLVLAFEHSRAARVARVAIDSVSDPGGLAVAESVRLLAATDSPLGPWTEVAAGELDAGAGEFAPDQPVWARYLRLVFAMPQGTSRMLWPDRIAVYEADGASVLAEWGDLSSAGPYEHADPPTWSGFAGAPENDRAERALALNGEEPAPGRALLDSYSSWYRLAVPAGQNHLELTVSGYPTVEGRPKLVDATGNPVELYELDTTPVAHRWEAFVEPGAEYLLEVDEPPRSVIFSWDTSGSVAAWLPIISKALMTYAETIKPGRDEVNLLPFGRGSPLLDDWVGQPYPLMRMLAAYPQETSSSAAEGTLAVAAREMIDRPGKKAVLLLTDAATSTSPELWPALAAGRPQVFAMKLSSSGAFSSNPHTEVDLMQDWAGVRGGHFEYITGFGSLASGFERAVTRLKRPIDFSVAAAFDFVDDPSPATIEVSFGDGDDAATGAVLRGAVEIILDASGSMLKRMDGTRRIDIAKAAIRDTVRGGLPDGVPLALRVYGHREAGSCRTDLEISPEPLDKDAFLARVEAIEAINLARTPIADSLAAVASDLAGVEGRKLVVLLTDGEETCEGDPAEAIRKLQEAGVDVRVNIVGFAIDDDSLKREFASWAELGGGSYFDASEGASLGKALDTALKVPFVVLDHSGEEVARGLVGGEPVDVPAGRYSVRVDTAEPHIERDVSLAPGDSREIRID